MRRIPDKRKFTNRIKIISFGFDFCSDIHPVLASDLARLLSKRQVAINDAPSVEFHEVNVKLYTFPEGCEHPEPAVGPPFDQSQLMQASNSCISPRSVHSS